MIFNFENRWPSVNAFVQLNCFSVFDDSYCFTRDERKEFIRAKYIQHKYAFKSGDNTDKILQVRGELDG